MLSGERELLILILGVKIEAFLRLSRVKKEYQLGENVIEIMINYLHPGQFFQYVLLYLQTMPFLLMYYTIFHFQLSQKISELLSNLSLDIP